MNNPSDFEGFGRQKYWVKIDLNDIEVYDDEIKVNYDDLDDDLS